MQTKDRYEQKTHHELPSTLHRGNRLLGDALRFLPAIDVASHSYAGMSVLRACPIVSGYLQMSNICNAPMW